MKCNNCGTELGEKDIFCPKCGNPSQKKGGNNMQSNNGEMYNYDRPVNQQINNNIQRPNSQNYGQSNMYGQQYGNNRGNGSVVKTCIVIVAIIAVVGFVIYLIVSTVNKDNNKSEIANNPTNIVTSSTTSQTSDYGTTSTSNTQRNSSTYKVNFGGFKLYIPDDLIYITDATNDMLYIYDDLATWVVSMRIEKGSYQQLKQNKSSLSGYFSESLSSYNATVSNATVENIDEIEFIIMEIKISGKNELLVLTELNSMYTACFEISNENNDFDRDVLKNLTSIIRTAEFNGDTKNLEIKGNIKATDIDKALQKIAEEKASDNNQ